jgi:Ca2+-binding EF-hand superfamily protein
MKKIVFTSIAFAMLSGCVATQGQSAPEQIAKTQAAKTEAAVLTKQDREKAKKDDRGHRPMPMTEQRLNWLLAQYSIGQDEQLTWAEYKEWRQTRFNTTDANDNGTVDVEEYLYEFENRLDKRYEQGRKAHIEQTNRRFKSLDKDENKAIEWSEYAASGVRTFARWDTNEDGVIDENDPKKASKYSKKKSGSSWYSKNPISYIRMPTTHNLKGLQSIYDANKDGAVSRDEFTNERRSVFYVTDTDKNGVLSAEEYLVEFEDRIVQTVDKSRRGSIKQTYVRFNALDDNKDEAMTFEEFQISGKRIFTRWDKNSDGVISSADIGE